MYSKRCNTDNRPGEVYRDTRDPFFMSINEIHMTLRLVSSLSGL